MPRLAHLDAVLFPLENARSLRVQMVTMANLWPHPAASPIVNAKRRRVLTASGNQNASMFRPKMHRC
jgi:hypothetical protein